MSNSDNQQRDAFLKTCLVKDLRVECRNRGINPAGSRDTLVDKLSTSMVANGETKFGRVGISDGGPQAVRSVNNYSRPEGQNVGNFVTDRKSSRVLAPPGGKSSVHFFGATVPSDAVEDRTRRSMSPPTAPKKESQRQTTPEKSAPPVMAPPQKVDGVVAASTAPGSKGTEHVVREGLSLANNDYAPEADAVGVRTGSNNYNRPGDRQNVGNYITGRNTSRVLAPPGGGSSITFG